MESKDIEPKKVIQDSEIDCEPKIILNKRQWETIYNWCDEYHSVKSKSLTDEIAELKGTIEVYKQDWKVLNDSNKQLKFELKAADSVNEQLTNTLGDALAESEQYGYLTNNTIKKANLLINKKVDS